MPKDAPAVGSVTQEITVVDGQGLGRTITLILSKPFQYANLRNADGSVSDYDISIARGTYDTFPFAELGITTPIPQAISNMPNDDFTVYFDLPNGLPEAMFPLDFQLESDQQGVQNNWTGSLTVSTGPSLFNPDATAISYIKPVTYDEYMYMYYGDTNDVDITKPNTYHTVRCRFKTISTFSGYAHIRVHNKYFEPDITVTVDRRTIR